MIERIKSLTDKIKDNWSLCEFFSETDNASEKEYLTAETIHACALNYAEHGECFSIRGNIKDSGGGLFKNATAYQWMIENGYFAEHQRTVDGEKKTVIIPTDKLLTKLERFFAAKGEKSQ